MPNDGKDLKGALREGKAIAKMWNEFFALVFIMKEIKKPSMLEPFFVHRKKKNKPTTLFSAQNLSKIKATKKKLKEQIR